MKKKIVSIMIAVMIIFVFAGCSKSKPKIEKEVQEKGLQYTTITEWFDWGPAITKVILNLGTSVDPSSLSTDTFSVVAERTYNYDGSAPNSGEKTTGGDAKPRNVLKVYPSDETGTSQTDGKYLTFELEVKPGMVESSPLNYETTTGLCNYVNTSYIIKLSDKANLKAKDGTPISIQPTDGTGYLSNKDMLPAEFDYSGSYKQDDIELLYASFTPKKASPKQGSTPLLVWLHGHSEGGHDPSLTVVGNQVVHMASEEIQSFFGDTGCNLLFPQAPTFWMDYDGKSNYNSGIADSEGKSYYTEVLMGLIKDYVAKHPEIDPNRIYIGGFSNGGYMTMNMIITYPDYFAAALPICEAYKNEWLTDEKLKSIVDVPIWFTHAKTDTTVRIYDILVKDSSTYEIKKDENGKEIAIYDYPNAAYDRLKKAGAKNVHYSLWDHVVNTTGQFFKEGTNEPYEYNGHFSWMYVYSNLNKDVIDGKEVTIFEWLSKQSNKK